ncbi:hypothetical protein HK101_011675 [Irineochytrium annulatum]|nr:hypothetical protein HK101_011675 [Irineochytrium annulatum]
MQTEGEARAEADAASTGEAREPLGPLGPPRRISSASFRYGGAVADDVLRKISTSSFTTQGIIRKVSMSSFTTEGGARKASLSGVLPEGVIRRPSASTHRSTSPAGLVLDVSAASLKLRRPSTAKKPAIATPVPAEAAVRAKHIRNFMITSETPYLLFFVPCLFFCYWLYILLG